MTIKAFRVDTKTLALIDSYLEKNPDGQKKISETLAASIAKLNEEQTASYPMLKETTLFIDVVAKRPFRKAIKAKHGQKGPYKVVKTITSFTGRDTFYVLEGSDSLFPAEWFQLVPPQKEGQLPQLVGLILWSVFLFAGGYSLGILQYIYLMMLL